MHEYSDHECDAPRHEPVNGVDAADPDQLQAKRDFPLTDLGNAERFAFINAYDIRYISELKRWLIWDGDRWAFDRDRAVYRRAGWAVRSIYAEAEHAEDPKAVAKHAMASEKKERIEAMLALAGALPEFAIVPEDLDVDPLLFNVANGTLNLATGQLSSHSRKHLITKMAGTPYDATACAPGWLAFLEQIIPDAAVREYLQRAVGYSLTGLVNEQCLFFLYGTGANGKTTFIEVIKDALGEYAKGAMPNLLLAKHHDQHPVELAALKGARLVTTTEAGEDRNWDEAKMKLLTGGDTITARNLFCPPFDFKPTHKFWVAANHKPKVRGTDLGFWRRMHLIPFTVTIPESERDPTLTTKLKAELTGVLTWAIEGCLRWHEKGLNPPPAVLEAVKAYRSAEDVIGAFLDECCVMDKDGRVTVGGLFDTYREWADSGNEKPMTKRAFSDAMEERGIERERTKDARWFHGLKLRARGDR